MPIGFASEAWPRPGLAEPRSASLAGFGFFHQHIRKGKVVITKTSKEKRLLLGSFLAPETDMIFGDGVGASLFEALIANLLVILCDVDAFRHWNSSAEEGACVGLKPDLQEGTGFNLLRVQFWTRLQRKRVSKRGQKVDPLKSKVVPAGGSSFGPFFGTFIVANLLKRLFQVEADLISSSCGWNLELGGPFLRARFFVRFEDQNRDLLCHIVFSNFHSLEALEACLEACPEVFCSNSHGLATLKLETCIEACLQLYFVF